MPQKAKALFVWVALAVIGMQCFKYTLNQANLRAARLGPDGYLSMQHPDYARIYYQHDTWNDAIRMVGTRFIRWGHDTCHRCLRYVRK